MPVIYKRYLSALFVFVSLNSFIYDVGLSLRLMWCEKCLSDNSYANDVYKGLLKNHIKYKGEGLI